MKKNKLSLLRFLTISLLFISSFSHAQEIDLLLKGGHVIDPKNQINSKMDVAITNGKIYQVAANISSQKAKTVVDEIGRAHV